MKKMLRRLKDQSGVTMAEYALILALVAVVGIVAWRALGTETTATVNTAVTEMQSARPAAQ